MNKFLQVMGVLFVGFLILVMWSMSTDSIREYKIGRCALSISKNEKALVQKECPGLNVDQTKASITLAKEINPELQGMDLYEFIAKETNPTPVVEPQVVKAEPQISDPVVPIPEKQTDLIMSPSQLVEIEHGNQAKFKRDIVGKSVQITGTVSEINDDNFSYEAQGAFGGWKVYMSDLNYLADLKVGQSVTITCVVEDLPIIGGASNCNK